MRTTLNLNDDLVAPGSRTHGDQGEDRLGLEALISIKSGERLARLAGTEPKLRGIPRRRTGS